VRKRILVVFETAWDRRQLDACRQAWSPHYEVEFARPSDGETPWDFDVVEYIARETKQRLGTIDGVFSMSDYPGASVAGAIASALGLCGSQPASILAASHKYRSRLAQREVVPTAVPRFSRLDPRDPATWRPPFGFPCFVKPVKGAFSVLSGVVDSEDAMQKFLCGPRAEWFETSFVRMFDRLVRHFDWDADARWFLAEEVLRGPQATVEGWRTRSAGGVLGIVDSTFRPGTRSFVRFDYPSTLPRDVQQRMAATALRVTEHLGLVDTLFNVEMTWERETDQVRIIEVNPRGCGQFADLYHKVDGVNGYEVALALAAGDPPRLARAGGGAFAAAASFPLRVFRPSVVRRAPEARAVQEVEAAHPGTLVWLECATGDILDDFDWLEDGESQRYAIVNVGGASRSDVTQRFDRVCADLGLHVEPREEVP